MKKKQNAGIPGQAARALLDGVLAAGANSGVTPSECEVRDAMKTITIEAKTERLPEVLSFIGAELESAACSMKSQMQLEVAVEELFVNIASYAYAPGTGDVEIGIRIEDGAAEIRFVDGGIPYDPVNRTDPDVNLPAEEREIGGLGILMVKKSVDEMRYAYRNGKNVLTIRKQL